MSLFDIFFKPKTSKKLSRTVTKGEVEYKFIKNKNQKCVKIKIQDAFTVTVSMPYSCTYKKAEEFLAQNKKWVDDKLEKTKESFELQSLNRPKNLIVERGVVTTSVKKNGENVIFTYPLNEDFYSKKIQTEYKKAVKKALYIRAKEYLPKRLKELSRKFGFEYNKIALKSHKTRWGSCSYANNINLNINLIELEPDLIDYVLIHELCHTVEKNHSKAFWELVTSCMPDAYRLRREIKNRRFIV